MANIFGTNGDDELVATAAGQTVFGLAGDDRLSSGFSETTLAGGPDDDRLVTDIAVDFTGSVAINGRLLGDDGDDRLEADGFAIARTSQDSRASALVHNALFGGGGGDELSATASARAEGDGAPARAFNVLYGGDGNDSLSAEATAIGGFSLTSARNDLQGGAGDDVLRGVIVGDVAPEADGASHLHGGDGNDSLAVVGGAYNLLDGGAGDDGLAGGSGIDWLRGGAGNDILDGRGGADMLYGGAGDDRLAGGVGDDELEGREGNDVLGGGDGNDKLWGETLDLLKAFASGGDGDDELSGGNGDDQLHGGLGANLIDGGNGNDTLFGGLGDDTIKGGDGDDFFSAESISDASRGLFVTTSAGDDEIFGGGATIPSPIPDPARSSTTTPCATSPTAKTKSPFSVCARCAISPISTATAVADWTTATPG